MTTNPKYTTDWARENPSADFIPYRIQLNENTVKAADGAYMQVIKLEGVAHESADAEDILRWKDQLNIFLRNIASPNISIWSNIVRRLDNSYPAGDFPGDFDSALNEKYKAHLGNKTMMVNELYLTIIYKPANQKAKSFLSGLSKDIEEQRAQQANAIEELDKVVGMAVSFLDQYDPRLLGTYEYKGILHSEVIEFFDYLANGDKTPRPLTRKPIKNTLARNRVFFGADSYEIRSMTEEKFGAIIGINEYPDGTEPGFLNVLLSCPFEFVLTQSFSFMARPVAIELLSRQMRRMETTEDLAVSQIDAMSDALDDLASGRIVFGHHHLTLNVTAPTQKELRKYLNDASTALAECSMVVSREDWALNAAYWSQLPGNHKYKPRPAPVTSLNFAGFSSMHNYPNGRISGNQWGAAVTAFQTSSGAPYYFNFHEPLDSHKSKKIEMAMLEGKEIEEDTNSQKALGNTLIIGPSGSGKTVVQGFLMSQSQKFKPTQVIFDKDRGLEIFVRANRGIYFPLETGKPTGFNPFQLNNSSETVIFLTDLVKKMCGGNYSAKQESELVNAVRGVLSLPLEMRRVGRLLDFLDPTESDGIYVRLEKWCGNGSLAWVFDNETDVLDFENNKMFGFEVSGFIDLPEVRTPLVMYLFHRVEKLIDGRRFQMWLDEFWKLLLDEYFEDLAQNKQKVIRKQNGIMVYGTQSAKDVLKSPIAHTLIEQCATLVFMPNPKAKHDDYVGGFNLSEREFQLVKEEMLPGSRQFLIKQGHQSVVATLNLKGFENELAVISGDTDNVALVNEIIAEHGDDPDVWLPIFHRERG